MRLLWKKLFVSESENHDNNGYMLVMEYADGGSLRNYLKENFSNLTWDDKYRLAYQLACGVLCLHYRGMVHCDLDCLKRLEHHYPIYKKKVFGMVPYIDPKVLNNRKDNALDILEKNLREAIVPDTPEHYVKIYARCWDGEPDNRPTIYQVFALICYKQIIQEQT
ncbi:kinase-like domain-containing protein [Rhizophagus diaphanus]|nr:kinase-like domain-containing protein [Rhizophagus diaphanus] [Rhizophagus sp. MUCL 43196]